MALTNDHFTPPEQKRYGKADKEDNKNERKASIRKYWNQWRSYEEEPFSFTKAGKGPTGLHLDVLKETKLIQKLMVDEKKCYLFGRNAQLNDFCIDHQSCSRVHAALVYHKHLKRAFLVDLGSTHGTFIGTLRLDANKPTQLPIDSSFHFGASTRMYVLRERPQSLAPHPVMAEIEQGEADEHSEHNAGLLGLPQSEMELENLTEFNTANNRRISLVGIPNDDKAGKKAQRAPRVTFNEDEDVINPEDVDPSIGRFRNMVETTIIPTKRMRDSSWLTSSSLSSASPSKSARHTHSSIKGFHEGVELQPSSASGLSRLGMVVPNPAPDIHLEEMPEDEFGDDLYYELNANDDDLPRKKKYAKEAWPGKKHGHPQPPSSGLLM